MEKDELAKRARERLRRREQQDAARTLAEFEKIRARLQTELDQVLKVIADARAAGETPTPNLIFQQGRTKRLLDAITDEIRRAAPKLAGIVSKSQANAIEVARQQSAGLPELTVDLQSFDSEATRSLIGISSDGAPLGKLFEAMSKPIREAMFDALIFGIASGQPNPVIAKALDDAAGIGRVRAMTITRTETNRAYRESSRQFYDTVPGVIGWRWVAALDLNTCPICWRMHGRIFKTKTKFGTHPNCRCTMVPVFAHDPPPLLGTKVFGDLNPAQQTAILGKKRFELYDAGVGLDKFVGTRQTPFGTGRFLIPSRDIVPPVDHK